MADTSASIQIVIIPHVADDETTTTSVVKSSKKKKKKKKQNSTDDVTPPVSSTSKGGGKSKKKKRQEFITHDSSDSTPDTETLDRSDRTINGHENSEDNSLISIEKEPPAETKEQCDREILTKPKKGKKAKEERRRARETRAATSSEVIVS